MAALVFAADDPKNNNPQDIQRTPATVVRRIYDPAKPPPQMPATQPDEAGATVSDFGCNAQVSGQITAQSADADQTQVTVRIDSVHIILKLGITEWVSKRAPQKKIWAHEDGHRIISLHFYDHAETEADIIALAWLGRSITTTGPDAAIAAKKAITQTAQKITDQYMAQVRDESELVQEAYDRITAHGTNDVDEADAIEQALIEVGKSRDKN